jgi:hypothetical protein
MRKHRVWLLATYYADSKTLSWHVEHEVDGGAWELLDEGSSASWSERSAMFVALQAALKATMVGG